MKKKESESLTITLVMLGDHDARIAVMANGRPVMEGKLRRVRSCSAFLSAIRSLDGGIIMETKKHLEGGTLHTVMASEVKRALVEFSGQDQYIEKAALQLGITPRTLRVWIGPVEKGGWEELQGKGGMAKLLATKPKAKAKKRAKSTKKAHTESNAAASA
jgi:hypothetical protein